MRRGRVSLPNQIYTVTVTTLGRQPHFRVYGAASAAAACFQRPQLLGDARLLAWVLMPDHAHWLLQLGESDALDVVVSRLKAASARATNAVSGDRGAVWSRAYHDRALRKEEDIVTVARYIIANPLRAGLVDRVGDYPFWNAVWVAPEAAPTGTDFLL